MRENDFLNWHQSLNSGLLVHPTQIFGHTLMNIRFALTVLGTIHVARIHRDLSYPTAP